MQRLRGGKELELRVVKGGRVAGVEGAGGAEEEENRGGYLWKRQW